MHEDVCKLDMRMHASYELPMFNLHYMKLDFIQGCIRNSIGRVANRDHEVLGSIPTFCRGICL